MSLLPAVQSDAIPPCRVSLGFSAADARPVGPSQIVLCAPARPGRWTCAPAMSARPSAASVPHPVVRLRSPSQACQGVALSVQRFEPTDRPGWFYATPWLLTPDSAEQ